MSVRVRFAPSPTGYLHIGGARTALFNWLFAQHHGGQFILRIEDTDQKRTIPGAMDDIMDSLRWLGITWDEGPDVGGDYGPYIQSERVELYQKWAQWLLDNGHAYKCFATAEELDKMRAYQKANNLPLGYDRRYRDTPADEVARLEAEGRPYVIRFKMPLDGQTVLPDVIRGDITFDNDQLNDLVLLKADGFPTYHLANVIDDHFMKITHIMRADEWINTGPLHVNIYNAFGWDHPVYAHLPVVLSPSGKGKLSKRDQAFQEDGQQILVQVKEFRKAGFLNKAVVNFLTNVGWSFGDDREQFTPEESIPRFKMADINPAPTKLPYSKLFWLNSQYLNTMDETALAQALRPYLDDAGYEINMDALITIVPALKPRLKTFPDALEFLQFLDDDAAEPLTIDHLQHKKMPLENAKPAFEQTYELLKTIEPFALDTIQEKMFALGEQSTLNSKAGPYLGTLRFAITRQKVSPPLFESIIVLGRAHTLNRLEQALALFNETD
ncbi:MAG TPA: glutamate--tRNA ligase [Anaerolineae bacterium]|nr:glutamate--tRNA ligase [Anaerolineae bacterium]